MLIPQGEATFSGCGRYRYRLTREFGGTMTLTIVMLNPSTADGSADDPTIRRCKGFARAWGYGRLVIVNLFAFRATDPRAMWEARDLGVDIVGEPAEGYTIQTKLAIEHRPSLFATKNDAEIWSAALHARGQTGTTFGFGDPPVGAGIVLCAWGKGGVRNAKQAKVVLERAECVAKLLGGDLWCLGTNESDGSPKHPLYLAEDTEAKIWRAA